MRRRRSPFLERGGSWGCAPSRALRASLPRLAALLLIAAGERAAHAQACCAGSGALTPGRLAMHEEALVGMQLRAGDAYGSFDGRGHYGSNPTGTNEYDFEEDAFAAIRFLGHGQGALFVPFVETRRQARGVGSEFGGGIGDVNLSARWDFLTAGDSRVVPGIGALVGLTLPTGTAPEDAKPTPLNTNATGIGAVQGNVGLALEQSFGPWLVNATGIVAKRFPRTTQGVHSSLATQVTLLGGVAYAFPNDAALAGVVSYAFEGDATIAGHNADDSGRRLLRTSVSGVWPFTDRLRGTASVYLDPPIVHIDQNAIPAVGIVLGGIFSWS